MVFPLAKGLEKNHKLILLKIPSHYGVLYEFIKNSIVPITDRRLSDP